jgi:hypothetical protein
VTRTLLASIACVLGCAQPALAQYIPRIPDSSNIRVRVGPVWMNPTVALTNLGIDNNVFNDADSDDPKSDFTMTVTPQTDLWLRMGRTWLTANLREDIVWYQDFATERSVNSRSTVGWVVPLTRVSFAVGGNWVNTRERPGFEIDARSQRTERAWNGAAELRALSKTFFGARAERRDVAFDSDAVFLGRNLREQLNRTETTKALTIRHDVTPLTSLSLEIGRSNDRFDFQPIRDSDSTRVQARLDFDPFALISGSAQVGYRHLEPLSAEVPEFSGATAAVSLSYVALGSTKLTVQANRDVQYSFDVGQPYYLQSGVSLALAQRIYGPVDVEGRLNTQRLSYRERIGAEVEAPDRVDHIRGYGAGVGYRAGRDLRIGVNLDQQKRTSDVERRQYEGLRFGLSVTYGL